MSEKLNFAISQLKDKIFLRLEKLKRSLYLGESTIISSEIAKNRDAETETQLYQSQLTEAKDVQTIERMHIPGMQYNAPEGSRGFFGKVAEAYKVFVGIDDNVPKQELEEGEKLDYSSVAGAIKCSIYYTADGKILVEVPDTGIIFDLTLHTHLGNLGFDTGPPVITGAETPPPVNPPSIDGNGNIVDGNGTKSTEHIHSQGNDSGGDTEVDTGFAQ